MVARSGLMTVMERAARKAGNRLRRDFGEVEHLQTSKKGSADFVAKAHVRAERTIYDELLKVRPDWGFVLEEGGVIEGDPTMPRWIIDPLDGMSNFAHAIPHFAISIAVQERALDGSGWGDITAALVYQPITDEHYWAERNRGSWVNERRINVSARRYLDESVIATGAPLKGKDDMSEWSRIFGAVGPEVAGIRRFGAASLDLAWLAAGRCDGFWDSGLQPWTVAGGILLVREAGGFVTDYRGSEDAMGNKQILAANDALHSRLHKIVAGSLR